MSGGVTANCTSQTASSVVLTVQSGTVAASTAATVTLTGFTMGGVTASVSNGVSVTTSHDANTVGIASVASGPVGDRVTLNSFTACGLI